MATDDQQILVVGTAATPASWRVPGNGQVTPRTVYALFDGSGAASPFQPALKVISDGGEVIGIYPCAQSVAAGGSANVTWFPGLGGAASGAVQALIGARIHATAAQTVATATATDLHYQSVDFDTDGMVNLGADDRILTVNTNGFYLVVCETNWVYNNSGRRLSGIVHNGYFSTGGILDANDSKSAIWASPVGGDAFGQPHTPNLSVGLFNAVAGDFFSSGCDQDSGGNLDCGGTSATTRNNSFLSAVLIAG